MFYCPHPPRLDLKRLPLQRDGTTPRDYTVEVPRKDARSPVRILSTNHLFRFVSFVSHNRRLSRIAPRRSLPQKV